MKNETPSKRSIDRAKQNPENVTATTLYALAEQKKMPMEALLHKPLWIFGFRIDGLIRQDNLIFAFQTDLPKYPPVRALYVFHANGKDIVSTRRQMKTYDYIHGIVVFEIKIRNTSPEQDIRNEKETFAYPRTIIKFVKDS